MGNARKFFTAGQRRAQTDLKHAILESYLAAFAGKTGSKSDGHNVGYLDGYAGPGSQIHKASGSRQDGSPRIAIRVARHLLNVNPAKYLHSVFIEPKQTNFDQLQALVDETADVDVVALRGKITDHVVSAMKTFTNMPVLVFLDPFGVGLDQENCLKTVLGRGGGDPTELLMNFSLDAVRRAGPYVKKPKTFAPRAAMLETMDEWLGGDWWQSVMLASDSKEKGATDRAANGIADEYAGRLANASGCDAFAVPMRRSATHKALFSLILFHPRTYAKFPYNEAVSNAQKGWRDTMRGIEVQRAEDELAADPSLGTSHVEDVDQVAKMEEVQLEADWIDTIYDNLAALINKHGSASMDKQFDQIFAGVKGLARGTHFRKAWNRLADDKVAERCPPGTKYDWAVVRKYGQGHNVAFR